MQSVVIADTDLNPAVYFTLAITRLLSIGFYNGALHNKEKSTGGSVLGSDPPVVVRLLRNVAFAACGRLPPRGSQGLASPLPTSVFSDRNPD